MLASGAAAASGFGSTGPAAETVTLSVDPARTAVTLTLPVADPPSPAVQAALADPARVDAVPEAGMRRALAQQLRDLDAFLATHAKLLPYRAHLWYVAHHASPPIAPRRLAALLWCTVWFPRDCG